MEREVRQYQTQAVKDIMAELLKPSIKKVGAFITCGLGKTFIGSDIAKKYLSKNKRVVISAYALKEIKENWLNKILDFKLIPAKDLQVIVSAPDIKLYQSRHPDVLFTTSNNICEERKVIIIIPQSVKSIKYPVDLFIVDEIHEYYNVDTKKKKKLGRLKQIIKSCSHKGTKILGLTGTGFEMVNEGDFSQKNKDVSYVIRDLEFALEQKAILSTAISMEYFNFSLSDKCYSKKTGDLLKSSYKELKKKLKLNRFGKAVLKSKVAKTLQLEHILGCVSKSKKTLVIVPRGEDINKSVKSYIEKYMEANFNVENSCVIKTSKQSCPRNDKAEREFRYNPNVKFMVVVDMCGTGWDFESLDNVVDLTFTRNKKLIIQRMARPCRVSKNKKPKYYFCTDQSDNFYNSFVLMMQCLNLTTAEGILNPEQAKRKIMFDEKIIEKVIGLEGKNGSICLGDIRRYFKDSPTAKRDKLIVVDIEAFLKGAYGLPWHNYVKQVSGNSNKATWNPKVLNTIASELNALAKRIPQESDQFMKRVIKLTEEYGLVA